MLDHVDSYAGDPIFSLTEAVAADKRARKANLGVGLYFDEDGQVPLLRAVSRAEQELAESRLTKAYLPMEGLGSYRAAVQSLLFGDRHEAVASGRVATIQSVGGSGALKIGADFLRRYFPGSGLWVSDPTWDNHLAIFEGAGFRVGTYPYYDPAHRRLDFERMLGALDALPARSVVLLHACCHNPTGMDLSQPQWLQVLSVIVHRGLLPFFDFAYQGFAQGPDEDAWVLRYLAESGVTFLVANSFSKNFGLYSERCGALSVVVDSADVADRVLGQLKATVRRNYSNPPSHGASIVARVLESPALRAQWRSELDAMRDRIRQMRQGLCDGLSAELPDLDFSFLRNQRGMFSFTGLAPSQVQRLRVDHGIYMVGSGRACVAGLNPGNLRHVVEAMASVMRETGLSPASLGGASGRDAWHAVPASLS
jgi:aromatic-amino-acid transaminase